VWQGKKSFKKFLFSTWKTVWICIFFLSRSSSSSLSLFNGKVLQQLLVMPQGKDDQDHNHRLQLHYPSALIRWKSGSSSWNQVIRDFGTLKEIHFTSANVHSWRNEISTITKHNLSFLLENYSEQIASLKKLLVSEVAKLKEDMNVTVKGLSDKINVLFAENDRANSYIDDIYKRLSTVDGKVATLDTLTEKIPEIQGQLEHLHSVNQIWRRNFDYVNETFESMSKRLNMRTDRVLPYEMNRRGTYY
jgi:hypothetical protein